MDNGGNVQVVERGLKKNEQGSLGDTSVSPTDSNGITHITIQVDSYRTSDDTYEHEWGHEKDAREQGGDKFVTNASADKKKYPDKSQHNDRPVEKSADKFKDQVNKERRDYHKQQKEQKKQEKERKKQEKQRKPKSKDVMPKQVGPGGIPTDAPGGPS